MTTPHDNEIVLALKNDAERGFKLLMVKYKAPIYWHIRRLVVAHDDAQDATQEAFIRVFRSFSQFRGDSPFSAWIYRIATNEALRLLEQRKREQLSLDENEAEANRLMADNYVDYTDLEAVKLQRAILLLPAKQQIAFNLRYYDELSYDEIAQITDSSAASVKTNYHLAKDKIVKYMKTNL